MPRLILSIAALALCTLEMLLAPPRARAGDLVTHQPTPAAHTAPLAAEHGVLRRARLDLAVSAGGVPPAEGQELWRYGMGAQLDLVFPLWPRLSVGARVRGEGRFEPFYAPGALDPSEPFAGTEWTGSGLLRVGGQRRWRVLRLGAELGAVFSPGGRRGWLWGAHLFSRVGRVLGGTLEMAVVERRFPGLAPEPELRLSVGLSLLLGGL